jgi:two-component system sensor histidine kinase KdpD
VLACTALSWVMSADFGQANLIMVYLFGVVVIATRWGRGPSALASLMSVAAFDFFFVLPYYTFTVHDTQYILTFAVLFTVGLVISNLTARVKEQAESARARETFTSALYGLSRDLSVANDLESISVPLSRSVREALGARTAMFIRTADGLKTYTEDGTQWIDEREKAVAEWSLKNGEPAGWSTDTLPGSSGYYLPLKTADGIFGVLGVYLKTRSQMLPLDRKRLLESFASQAALAIERVRLSEETQKARLHEEREKLQTALFNSISHDLRTPLVSITGSLSGMLENPAMAEETRKDLLENAYEEAGRLNRLVGNLLDMARLEADALKVTPTPCEIKDVVGAALKSLEERLSDRKVTVSIEDGLPHIPMDFSLIMKVLVNLLDNAIKYAPFGLPIDIEAARKDGRIQIKIMDRGLGIPEGDMEHVFDKFYRVKRPQNIEGTGLGLSICKGIVEAHGGTIRAEARPGGGTILTLSLRP